MCVIALLLQKVGCTGQCSPKHSLEGSQGKNRTRNLLSHIPTLYHYTIKPLQAASLQRPTESYQLPLCLEEKLLRSDCNCLSCILASKETCEGPLWTKKKNPYLVLKLIFTTNYFIRLMLVALPWLNYKAG